MWLIGFEALTLPSRHADVIAEHRLNLDAIARHDPEAAAAAAHEHIVITAAAVL